MRCPRTAAARPAHDGPVVDSRVEQEQEQVRSALAQLSNRQRAVVYRSYCLGWTTMQIAAALKTDDDAVKHELHHALHAFRVALLSPSCGFTS